MNEDHYLILRLGRHQETLLTSLPEQVLPKRFEEFAYGMIVADGMGGTGSGEAASRIAITTLVNLAIYFGKWNLRIDESITREVVDRAERFYQSVDSTLLRSNQPGTPRLQATLTAAFTAGTDLFYAHIGHSRAYLFRNDELLRLTRDHTLAAGRPSATTLVDVADSARDLQHILTDVLGTSAPVGPRIDVEHCSLSDGDLALLCTNGLTDTVDEAGIAKALRLHRAPDDQSRALVDLAVAAGANDDVTALVAQYRLDG